MSVAAHSPCYGHKRPFEHPESFPNLVTTHKRLRKLSASPHGRRDQQTAEQSAHALSSSARAALCGLFPEMDEQASSGRPESRCRYAPTGGTCVPALSHSHKSRALLKVLCCPDTCTGRQACEGSGCLAGCFRRSKLLWRQYRISHQETWRAAAPS